MYYISIYVCIYKFECNYELCLKSNRTGVTNNQFLFQSTNFMISLSNLSPLSLMHFPILHFHISVYR